jgi:hypothetical protein
MTTLALIAVRLAEGALAASARDRWQGVQHLPNGGSIVHSAWFKIVAVTLFAIMVTAFAAVTLYNRFSQRKKAEREFARGISRRQLTEQEIELLVAITERAGLQNMADIFLMGDVFDKGADMLIKESYVAGNPTNETGPLEKHLAGLKEKMNFRKAAGGGYYTNGSAEKPSDVKPAHFAGGKTAYIALFPFLKKLDLKNGNGKEGDSPPRLKDKLPGFIPALIIGLDGRVVFMETALPANVGDRVLVVFGPGDGAGTSDLIEDIGVVEKSIQPAVFLKEPDACRLAVSFGAISDEQAARIAGMVGSSNFAQTTALAIPVAAGQGAK